MQGWIKPKIPNRILLVIFIIAIAGYFLVANFKTRVQNPAYPEQVAAAETMLEAMEVLREVSRERGFGVSRDLDPNQTGLIGQEFTELTTSTGYIDSKRTSTNPDFAALMVKYFRDAGLKKGDYVGIGGSGSFPSLILASLCAVKILELRPIIIYSVGASMYGATIPGWTFIDMLDALNREGIFQYRVVAVSMGGVEDRARGFFRENRELMLEIMEKSGAEIIYEDELIDSIERRKEIYTEESDGGGIACFVNIGGASANYGTTLLSLNISPGLIKERAISTDEPERGLIFDYLDKGVPVVHLLNIRSIASREGIPIDPVPFPSPGTSGVYFEDSHPRSLIIFLLSVLVVVPVSAERIFRKKDQGQKNSASREK